MLLHVLPTQLTGCCICLGRCSLTRSLIHPFIQYSICESADCVTFNQNSAQKRFCSKRDTVSQPVTKISTHHHAHFFLFWEVALDICGFGGPTTFRHTHHETTVLLQQFQSISTVSTSTPKLGAQSQSKNACASPFEKNTQTSIQSQLGCSKAPVAPSNVHKRPCRVATKKCLRYCQTEKFGQTVGTKFQPSGMELTYTGRPYPAGVQEYADTAKSMSFGMEEGLPAEIGGPQSGIGPNLDCKPQVRSEIEYVESGKAFFVNALIQHLY